VTLDRSVPDPDATELRAAALAALAEAGLVFLPVREILKEAAEVRVGIAAAAAVFVAVYVTGVVLACRFRGSGNLTLAAALVALFAGLYLGRADPTHTAVSLLVALVVTLRIVTLGLRDWREPILAEIGVGATVLGIEVLLASGAVPEWRLPLLVFVPVFFAASLASRVVVVWAPEDDAEPSETRGAWIRRATGTTVAFAGAMAAVAMLAVRGGLFEWLGAVVSPLVSVAISVLATVLVVVLRPLFWIVNRLGIDPAALRHLLDEWRRRTQTQRAIQEAARTGSPWWPRLIGLAIFGAIVYALYRSLRRLRPDRDRADRGERRARVGRRVPLAEEEALAPRRRPFHHELPADSIRRWYAEALLALRDRGMPKEPALTPGEFLPEVEEAVPSCAASFRRLTHAYEDVRYGLVHISADRIHAMEDDQRRLLAELRRPA
jgi:Domain of unknown function (DUF4129)